MKILIERHKLPSEILVTTAKAGRVMRAVNSCASFSAAARTRRVDCFPIQIKTSPKQSIK